MLSAVQTDLSALIVTAICFAAFLSFIEFLTRSCNFSPEGSRKAVHIGGGLLSALFPWIFSSAISVLILAVLNCTILILGSKFNLLHSLNRVHRRSRGSEYYPIAVFLTFLLNAETPWFYVSSIFVLTWADAGAALIGSKFGRHRYLVDEEFKSVEGSSVFLILAFAGIAFPLLLLSPLPVLEALLSAFLVAMVATGIEAISRHGRDNLFVPLVVTIVLQKITTKPLLEIVYQNLSLFFLSSLVVFSARGPRALNAGATIATMLFLFAAWSLGSEIWAAPILGSLVVFTFAIQISKKSAETIRTLKSSEVVRALVVPLVLLITSNLTRNYDFYFGPFVLCCALIPLGFLGRSHLKQLGAASFVFVFLPLYLFCSPNGSLTLFIDLAILVFCGGMFILKREKLPRFALPLALIVASFSLLVIQYLGLPSWVGHGESVVLY